MDARRPAVFEADVETVRVRTDRGTALGPFGYKEGQTQVVGYDGDEYRLCGELAGE